MKDVEPDETYTRILCYVCKLAACMDMRRKVYRVSVRKCERKRWFGRPKRRREINIRY